MQERIREKQSKWRYKIAILSGKGGVGKSTVAVNLAATLAKMGYRVGLLDADIHGPNVAKMIGLEGVELHAEKDENGHVEIIPAETDFDGKTTPIKVMSIGNMVGDDQPIIWRGPLVTKALWQLIGDTKWGELDFFIVDFPPGTGDEIITVAQSISLDAAVIVTTPQDVAILDASKALNFMKKMKAPYIAVVENMSYLVCPYCGHEIDIFGKGGGKKLAKKEGVEFLGEIPLNPKVREAGDAGVPIAVQESNNVAKAFEELAKKLIEKLGAANK
jgi:ATP-binding protein involved in chromosome partitioning